VKNEQLDLARLTEWSVEARYPGDWPDATGQDASLALETARKVVDAVSRDLAARESETASWTAERNTERTVNAETALLKRDQAMLRLRRERYGRQPAHVLPAPWGRHDG